MPRLGTENIFGLFIEFPILEPQKPPITGLYWKTTISVIWSQHCYNLKIIWWLLRSSTSIVVTIKNIPWFPVWREGSETFHILLVPVFLFIFNAPFVVLWVHIFTKKILKEIKLQMPSNINTSNFLVNVL